MGDDEYQKRIESEARLGFHLTNEMLDCKDCMFRIRDKSAICEVYEDLKPVEVLNGGECVVKRACSL